MDHFHYRSGVLFCEDVPVAELAERYGTPLFIYSRGTILQHLAELMEAFEAARPLICYSLKTNPNLSICRLLHEAGTGFDVTSGGELHRALKTGCPGEKIVFAGVGKTDEELRAGLEANVLTFNVESEAEFSRLAGIAASMGKMAAVALRVNPDLPPKTHVKTDTSVKGAKFGFDITGLLEFAAGMTAQPHLRITGLHMHLGSPIYDTKPYRKGTEKGVELIDALRRQGHPIKYLNMGGGFGIDYRKREALPALAFAEVIVPAVRAARCKLILEPGRFIVGNAGVLVSRVLYLKETGGRGIVIQDAAMNDLIRPTLYDAFHGIWPVAPAAGAPIPADYEADIDDTERQDVVGPVCESGDFLARNRPLPPLSRGDLLATFSAGAYGMAMSSNYNGRPRAAEVLVDGTEHRLIRRRETYADLLRTELEIETPMSSAAHRTGAATGQ
jgi:diaminopimelate decarboxylase